MNDVKAVMDRLWEAMINYEFFADRVEQSKVCHKTLIVYVDTMSKEILTTIPDNIEGYNVVVHYASSLTEYVKPILLDKSIN